VEASSTVEQLRASGDPLRWSIVTELRGMTCCACELARVAGVSASLLSNYLNVLRKAGLVAGARRGRWIEYSFDEGAMESLVTRLDAPDVDEVALTGRGS
jgi:ArsR family transcriptional regulator, arsenate/arsenite/antimonite-responsive transcriptional repressor